VSILTAIALFVFVIPESSANRLSTLGLAQIGFDERYIQFQNDEQTLAAIVDRSATSLRRGEVADSATSWAMTLLEGGGWIARTDEEGASFFVPVNEVSDWVYPFLYSFIRERRKGLELPRAEWTTVLTQDAGDGLSDIALQDLGERTLKNVPDPVRCWAL